MIPGPPEARIPADLALNRHGQHCVDAASNKLL
jgi:hypothetical protein